jgi:hypothetical protein
MCAISVLGERRGTYDVVGHDPADPREVTQGLEKITRNEVYGIEGTVS